MQKRIQKETGNNCLKRIIVAFLAVIMMTTMLHPQMVQAATGITIESQGNKVPTYKAGEKKTWTFTVTNHSGKPINNVTEKQLTAEDPVEVRMEMQLREMVLFRV